jgi:hypothetical protein
MKKGVDNSYLIWFQCHAGFPYLQPAPVSADGFSGHFSADKVRLPGRCLPQISSGNGDKPSVMARIPPVLLVSVS